MDTSIGEGFSCNSSYNPLLLDTKPIDTELG
jgi:hypothetical protein